MPRSFRAAYLPEFLRDVEDIAVWSFEQFGSPAADRYGRLIRQALRDILEQPTRPGAKPRPDLAPNAYVYHIAFSRQRVTGERVKAPRHFVLYRHTGREIQFARLLHDSRDFARHIPFSLQDE